MAACLYCLYRNAMLLTTVLSLHHCCLAFLFMPQQSCKTRAALPVSRLATQSPGVSSPACASTGCVRRQDADRVHPRHDRRCPRVRPLAALTVSLCLCVLLTFNLVVAAVRAQTRCIADGYSVDDLLRVCRLLAVGLLVFAYAGTGPLTVCYPVTAACKPALPWLSHNVCRIILPTSSTLTIATSRRLKLPVKLCADVICVVQHDTSPAFRESRCVL